MDQGQLEFSDKPYCLFLDTEEEVNIFRELVSRGINTWANAPEMAQQIYGFLHQVPER